MDKKAREEKKMGRFSDLSTDDTKGGGVDYVGVLGAR